MRRGFFSRFVVCLVVFAAAFGVTFGALRAGGVTAVSRNGVLGDPTGASAEEGHRLLDAMADTLRAGLANWSPGPDGRLS